MLKRIPHTCAACALMFALFLCGCASTSESFVETWPDQMRLTGLEPLTVLPGTELSARGTGFVGPTLALSRLSLRGSTDGAPVDTFWLGDVVSSDRMTVSLEGAAYYQLCPNGDGTFVGNAAVDTASIATDKIYSTPVIPQGLHCRTTLDPELLNVQEGDVALNARIGVTAENLLLGTAEGRTVIEIEGCFLPQGNAPPCSVNGAAVPLQRLDVEVTEPELRRDGTFQLAPDLVGLHPGTLEATVRLTNIHGDDFETYSGQLSWQVSLQSSRLDSVDAAGASLGGFVDFVGAGFVGAENDEVTEILLTGEFNPDKGGNPLPLDLILVTSFHSGELARYVLDDQDSLGQIVDLRQESGTVSGTFTPRIAKGADSVTGDPVAGSFRIELIRQVVYVNFMHGYTDALEQFGLREADFFIRQRILEKAAWIYRGINVEFREEVPEDYLLYAQVDITGVDPNGLGLMGYDNTPGKDVGNDRLYDRIGGVNALTQEDGYPGFGGVFVESFFAFSLHPPLDIEEHPAADPLFDAIFDPVRPDTGDPVRVDELNGLPAVGDAVCPADSSDRPTVIACAIYVMGNLLGGTMAHELGHSLGLADPGGSQFHNGGEEPNRLMDTGGMRPFFERAELNGGGPEVFCEGAFFYLQSILPVDDPTDPVPNRPVCF